MKYEYAIYDILGWIFNKWSFTLAAYLLAWIVTFPFLRDYWLVVSLLVQSLLVCGIVWGVSIDKELLNLYLRSLTQEGTSMRFKTIVATIIAAAVMAAGVVVRVAPPIEVWPKVLHTLSIILLPVALILQSILGLIVLLVLRSQRRRMFRVSVFRSIVRYIVITVVSFLLTHIIWSSNLFVDIFYEEFAFALTEPLTVPKEYFSYPPKIHTIYLTEVLVPPFALFVLARVLISILGYRRSSTKDWSGLVSITVAAAGAVYFLGLAYVARVWR